VPMDRMPVLTPISLVMEPEEVLKPCQSPPRAKKRRMCSPTIEEKEEDSSKFLTKYVVNVNANLERGPFQQLWML